MDKKRTKTAYGEYRPDLGRFILRPVKRIPFMAPIPCAVFPSIQEAEQAADAHGYRVIWDKSPTPIEGGQFRAPCPIEGDRK